MSDGRPSGAKWPPAARQLASKGIVFVTGGLDGWDLTTSATKDTPIYACSISVVNNEEALL
ncbi:hypothetical protein PAAG_03523 [Paracoccidioides lutzii Pb01]|uniref:Uncharacterized protein n=1 Tax=Paracoccidioides lutzii (strain ATCC MYA-826 / Pb01) TaxID=502779 RepID=C1GXE9_PARBA|nr:hypothetical protein PAAG_03523 [Paracoccidioides lutzii Pb01]EEH41237.2 hypothetical protein PAAG_03523 [Paracoccidioides lutzii Pb01]